jgi:hypothetical protein
MASVMQHSIVTDINGTSVNITPFSRPTIQGATYDDNIIYAWGDITDQGGITSDFGVHSVQLIQSFVPPPGRFKYLVILNHVLNDGTGTQRVFTDGSVTATLEAPVPIDTFTMDNDFFYDCSSISCTKLFPVKVGPVFHTAFIVYISDRGPTGSDCKTKRHSFMFKVCGRRNANDPDNSIDPNP